MSETMPVLSEEELQKAFLFTPNGELVDPTTTEGVVNRVVDNGEVQYFESAVNVKTIVVDDPYAVADPKSYQAVKEYVESMEQYIADAGFDPLQERQERHPYVVDKNDAAEKRLNRRSNPFLRAWLHDETVESLIAWQGLIPSARALGYLANPVRGLTVVDKDGIGHPITTEALTQMRYVEDSVAIRNRGVAMGYLALEHFRTAKGSARPLDWLDVGCGTAEYTVKALKKSEDAGVFAGLVALDSDDSALALVGENAKRFDYSGKITTLNENITSPDYVAKLKEGGYDKGFHIVGNMGFMEYLPERDLDDKFDGDDLGGDDLGRFRDFLRLPNASTFTRNSWDMVAESGALISGNMAVDRPQINFVFGIVNWPVINARSDEDLLRIYKRAGVLDDPQSKTTIYRVKDSVSGAVVYNLIKIDKLAS